MSRKILEDIINDFSPEKFSRFFREKNRAFTPRQESFAHYDDEFFTGGLKIGEIQFSESEKLLVCAFKAGQPLSERSGKKAQYEKGKRILKETHFDAGVFIFYDIPGNFRFSLIYDIPKEKGRRDWSSFRRFTYFVSCEFTNKTFLQRIGDGFFPSLDKIKDAFSVEKVTKEFYEQYRRLFEALVSDLNKNRVFQMIAEKNQINTADFAKKLLGQIVFLYFLQKKGWLGVPQNKPWGEGDKNFVSNLYKQAEANKENFFNDYLEILFYDTLNNAHREGADPSFSKHFKCRIPFLNGGLFESEYDWQGTKIYLENDVFEDIFEVFDRYNFTVEEDSPDDKEVAVDPEMLGKVFENLLEENLRKGRGTYYTPREIVHYMCQESLINFLKTASGLDDKAIRSLVLSKTADKLTEDDSKTVDKLLADIKVCDPACGSGAFLVGMLHEIISARLLLNPGAGEYGLKKEAIQNCIYGVDIDPGAVEIAKLRLWLSLVVDYNLADIEPLPNLDYKVMCGNSLLEELIVGDESIKLFDEKLLNVDNKKKTKNILFDENDFKEVRDSVKDGPYQKLLKEKQRLMLDLHNQGKLPPDRKKELDKEIAEIQKTLKPKKNIATTNFQYQFAVKADKYFSQLRELHKYYFTEYDPDKKKAIRRQIENIELEFIKSSIDEKVSAVEDRIRNLNMQNPEDRKKQAGLMKKKLEYLAIPGEIHRSKTRPYFLWHLNFFEVFQDKGGFDVVIANPPYDEISKKSQTEYFKKYYSEVLSGHYDLYIFFFKRAFAISGSKATISFITPHTYLQYSQFHRLRTWLYNMSHIYEITTRIEGIFETAVVDNAIISLGVGPVTSDQTTRFSTKKIENDTLVNIESKIIPKSAFSDAAFDLLAIQNAVFIERLSPGTEPLGDVVDSSQGITVYAKVQGKKIDHFREKVIDKTCKPVTRGREITKYRLDWSGKFIRYGDWLWCPRDPKFFEQPKIFLRQTADTLIATFVEEPMYCIDSVHSLISKANKTDYDLKFILGVLNSKLGAHIYEKLICETGKVFAQVKLTFLRKFPIKKTLPADQIKIAQLVVRILEAKRQSPEVNTGKLEREIDQMVYKLYDLTPAEIKIVEGTDSNERNSGSGKPRKSKPRLEKARSA